MITAHKLRQARKRLGLTQTKIARRARVAQSTISKWESGLLDIDEKRARKAYRLCSISVGGKTRSATLRSTP